MFINPQGAICVTLSLCLDVNREWHVGISFTLQSTRTAGVTHNSHGKPSIGTPPRYMMLIQAVSPMMWQLSSVPSILANGRTTLKCIWELSCHWLKGLEQNCVTAVLQNRIAISFDQISHSVMIKSLIQNYVWYHHKWLHYYGVVEIPFLPIFSTHCIAQMWRHHIYMAQCKTVVSPVCKQ